MHLLQVVVEFAVVLGFMVLVHEFGHFAVAKLCGVRVEAFALGFGTRLFGVKYRGTDYCVNLLPLGGYVKMTGEITGRPEAALTDDSSDPGDFNNHPRWQRALIALAGPVCNFVLAFLLLWIVAHYHHEVDQYLNSAAVVDYVPDGTAAARTGLHSGDTLVQFDGKKNPTWLQVSEEAALHMNATLPIDFTHNGITHHSDLLIDTGDASGEFTPDSMAHIGLLPRQQAEPIIVQALEPDTPAAAAGLQPGDRILEIDGLPVHSVQSLLAYMQDRNGAPATLQVLRAGQDLHISITPRKLMGNGGQMEYRLGFHPQPTPVDVVRLPWGKAARQSLRDNQDSSTLILRVLKGMFTRQVAVKSVSGPVGMAQIIDTAAHEGYWTLLSVMSAISINLGILNLLPFPVLDGGMILFLIVEGIMRRDVNQALKERMYQVAVVCLILFMVLVMFNDITKLHLRP